MKTRLSVIVAMTEEGVIGVKNTLPWHLPEDLKRFKQITMGHPIVMGRKTFDSIGKILPGRENVVLSRDPQFAPPGVTVLREWEEALQKFEEEEEVFVIGGAQLFEKALPEAARLYLTIIHRKIEGDTFFPDSDWSGKFKVIEAFEGKSKAGLAYTFLTADRR